MADLLDQKKSAFAGKQMLVFWAAMLMLAAYACTHMVAAGDTWVALACGKHYATHDVNTVEPFSANSHKAGPTEEYVANWPKWAQTLASPFSIETVQKIHPTGWINQNWLTHKIFYQLVNTFNSDGQYNYNMLVVWKFAVNIIAVIVVYLLTRSLGVNPALSAITAGIAMTVGRSFIDIRPAVFSNALVPIYILILALAVYKNIKFAWLLVPLTVFWANVHGGYIYIFIMLVPFMGLYAIINLPKKWTMTAFFAGAWLALYITTHKLLTDEHYINLQNFTNLNDYVEPSFLGGFFVFIAFLILICAALAFFSRISSKLFYTCTIAISAVLFMYCLSRHTVSIPKNVFNPQYLKILKSFTSISMFNFMFVSATATFFGIILSLPKQRLHSISFKNILHIGYAATAALIASIIFNPYHLTNLTHTFEISLSKHAESWRKVNEWHPAFEWENPVGTETPFLIMFIILSLAAITWLIVWMRRPVTVNPKSKKKTPAQGDYEWPAVNLPLMAISILTVYMAIKSRRFIPLAAVAGAPFIALFIDQSIKMISAGLYFKRNKSLSVFPLGNKTQKYITATVGILLAVSTVHLGIKSHRLYIAPWLFDNTNDSIFMRMTSSNNKPLDAGKFIVDNNIQGKMFNYWTEGGAIAFSQTAQPETNKVPLQLFMDGRAQAAYDHETFLLWNKIAYQAPAISNAQQQGRDINNLNTKDRIEIGKWIDQQMQKYDIWVILMPSTEYSKPFVNGITTVPHWQAVYMDNYQMLLVNTKLPQGRKLLSNVVSQKAIFPTELSKNITMASIFLNRKSTLEKGFDYAKKAFEMDPATETVRLLFKATSRQELSERSYKLIIDFLNDFQANSETYIKQQGYKKRFRAARGASNFLAISLKKTNANLAKKYKILGQQYENQAERDQKSGAW